MENSFEQLPKTVAEISNKLDNIEKLLLGRANESKNDSDSLMTIEQAAELLTLKVATIYSLVNKGLIPYSKKNRRLYFDKTELIAWVKSGRKSVKL
jgi:excisionase family DNA binding protein